MARLIILSFALIFFPTVYVSAQTVYVDAVKGSNDANGTMERPVATLQKAVELAKLLSGHKPVTIKVAPGLYLLTRQLKIEQGSGGNDTAKFTIEAMVMPDDSGWEPSKTPVIQSISDTNRGNPHFRYCVAFQIERSNVCIKGLKFVGNALPGLEYYYAIERKDSTLKNLDISQCYFIGEKNSAPMQGAVFAQGAGIHINHCIFYGCKNAVLVFLGIADFSLTHSIIYGAYEGAVWFGFRAFADLPFIFNYNIVANGNYFFVGYKGVHANYAFSNSLISGNTFNMGFNGMEIGPDTTNKPAETNIAKTGRVILNEATDKGTPKDYLNLAEQSAGREIPAGIFLNTKK